MDVACVGSTFEYLLAGKRTRATELHARSMKMKRALISTAAGVTLLAAASLTSAQQQQQPEQQNVQPSARQTMEENANASAQSNTDMSYGGVPDTQNATGVLRPIRPDTCPSSPRCNLYSKH
jgi:orotidine-5'-phosphate decarboxylase